MFLGTFSTVAAQPVAPQLSRAELPKSKRTPLDLYLTPQEANQALMAAPEIVFVDVRDPVEITYVGHPTALDAIVPLRTTTHNVDVKSGQYKTRANGSFVADFDAVMARLNKSKDDKVFVTCRSGSRSAAATRLLVAAGYTNVWNLVEGFEGDKAKDGSRSANGWRNAGLPWKYRLGPNLAWSGRQ